MTKQVTINELAVSIGHDYQTTSALVKVLVGIGAAKEVGKRANPAGTRGKPSAIYEVENEIDLVIWPELVENPVDSVDTSEVVNLKPVTIVEEKCQKVVDVEPIKD